MSKIFNINSNWEVVNGEHISKVLSAKFLKENTEIETNDLEEIVNVEKAILLEQNNSTDCCEINLSVHPTFKISHLSLVSNCSKFELFTTKIKEYYKTSYGEFIDDFEGIKTYRLDIIFDKDINTLTQKFITNSKDIWIYGILILLQKNEDYKNAIKSTINLSNVEQRLKESNQEISENAFKCKHFLESNMKNFPTVPIFNQAAFINEFSKMNEEVEIEKTENLNGNYLPSNLDAGVVEMAKNYIDYKMNLLESEIIKKIDNKFNEMISRQDEKLDKILKKLDMLDRNTKI